MKSILFIIHNIEYSQLLILIAQCLVVAAFLLIFFRLRKIFGLGLFYIAIGLFKFMHYFFTQAFSLEIAPGIQILIGPTVITSAILFSLFLIYIREDAGEVRKIIYALIFFNFFFAVMLRISALGINGAGFVNKLNLPEHFFRMDIGSLIAGSLVLFLDGIVLIVFYEFISKKISSLFLRIFFTMTAVLFLHALIFNSIVFIFRPVDAGLLQGFAISTLISKAISISVYTVIFWLYFICFERRVDNSKQSGSSFRDVFNLLTYRQKYELTQDKLKESEKKFRTLVEESPVGIFLGDSDGNATYINDKCAELVGVPMENALNMDWVPYIHNDDRDRVTKSWAESITKQKNFNEEFRWVHSDGKVVWTHGNIAPVKDKKGNVLVYIGTLTDITERKQAEESLLRSEERYRLMLNTTLDGFILADEEGKIMQVNPSYCDMIGYNEQDLLSMNIRNIEAKLSDQEIKERIQQMVSQGKAHFETRHRTKDGHFIDLDVSISILKIDKKTPLVAAFVRDITERKRAEEELGKYREHLEELVKARTEELQSSNKDLEAFAYSVAHDLRAPLRAINGFTRILMEDYVEKLDDEGKRLGDVIQENAKKMGKLIDDLLAFSRLSRASMNFSGNDMKNMANAIYHEATSSTERKRIKFSVADLPDAYGDTNMFRQVWMNLISNAIKFSSKREKAVISITGIKDDEKTTYRISDNGVGFDMKYVNKIFDVFQRLHTETEYPGTGVGLSIVQRIINRHKGKIWVESEVDKGATFYFSLPNKVD